MYVTGPGREEVADLREDEFDEFYRARYGALVRTLFLQTGDVSRAEECAQEAFLRAWQQRRQLQSSDPIRWVTQVGFRLAVSDWRRTHRLARALSRVGAPAPVPPHAPENLLYVMELMQRLPNEQRSVVVLHYFNDLSVNGVADVLGISPGTVKSRLSRARDQMRTTTVEENVHGRSR